MSNRVITAFWQSPCDCECLARIHAAAFDDAWNADSMAVLLAQPGVFAVVAEDAAAPTGFGIIRVVVEESEILTLAVLPASRKRGVGRALVRAGAVRAAELGAKTQFLEVNVGNSAAKALYAGLGFAEVGLRVGYYRGHCGVKEDALVLSTKLPLLGGGLTAQPSEGCGRGNRSQP